MGTEKNIIEEARLYAVGAHRRINQRRKYSFQPYEVHLKAVAEIITQISDDPNMVAAAWLHDVIEDTPATFEDIEKKFNQDIVALVHQLTDVSRYEDGNRALRKRIDREHIAKASDKAKIVKLADLIDNCADICANDSGFGKIFLAEMDALLNVINQDLPLYKRARKTHDKWKKRLSTTVEKSENLKKEDKNWWHQIDTAQQRTIKQALEFLMTRFTARDIAHPYVQEQQPKNEDQIVDIAAPLSLVVNILSYFDVCYVSKDNKIRYQIKRHDFDTPIARTWLAGIIILYDQTITDLIFGLWPEDTWRKQLSSGRLQKTKEMAKERKRRNQDARLIDCLQFSDKLQILGKNQDIARMLGFDSTGAARRVHKDLESLRNNLAHGQQIATHDWIQITRLSELISEILFFQRYAAD